MRTRSTLLIAVIALLASSEALADCVADTTVAEAKQAHERGRQREQAGDTTGALAAYVAAQGYTCEPNSVAAEAARRAAAIALPLGDAAMQRGDYAAAFDLYERGGHFAAADRALLARVQAEPDDASLYGQARQHADYRALPAFQANEAQRLAVTGPYQLDAALKEAVLAMPMRAAERALAAEDAAFDEAWYAQYLALIQSRPDNPADIAAVQQYVARHQALGSGQRDPLRDPLRALDRIRDWERQVVDPALAAALAKRRSARAEARVMVIARQYTEAPEMLELAIDYMGFSADEDAARQARIERLRRQAEQLGDAAAAKQRNAAAMAAQFSDPRMIAEMQRQAQEMQRALQAAGVQ